MAIAEHPYRQQPLDKLELPNNDFKMSGFSLPSADSHTFDDVEFYLDLDLDQLTVFLGDKSIPYDVEDVSSRGSVLIDSDTDEVIGITLNDFLRIAVKTHPELTLALRYATLISGDSVLSPTHNPPVHRKHIRTRFADWLFSRTQSERRKAVFLSFADALGMC